MLQTLEDLEQKQKDGDTSANYAELVPNYLKKYQEYMQLDTGISPAKYQTLQRLADLKKQFGKDLWFEKIVDHLKNEKQTNVIKEAIENIQNFKNPERQNNYEKK